jgi:hypothetical protein
MIKESWISGLAHPSETIGTQSMRIGASMTPTTARLALPAAWMAFSFLTLLGCNGGTHKPGSRMLPEPAPMQVAVAQGADRQKAENLAYEHTISIELSKAVLPTRIGEIQVECAADKEFGCTLLDVSMRSSGDVPSGSIQLRLAPSGVDLFTRNASKDGEVTSRSTHAEDLTEPMADTERQLSLLTTHRDRLEGFMKDKSLKVDQVIAVSKELASVQTQIEALRAAGLNLHRRIDTELLTLNFSVPWQTAQEERKPIRDAIGSFGSDFTDAVAQVIRFLAALVPWLLIVAPGLILLRLFWRMIGRWLARRES